MKTVLLSQTGYVTDDASGVLLPRFHVQPVMHAGYDDMTGAPVSFALSHWGSFVLRETPQQARYTGELYTNIIRRKMDQVTLRQASVMVAHVSMQYLALPQSGGQSASCLGYQLAQNMQDIFASTDQKFGDGLSANIWQESKKAFDQWQMEKAMNGLRPKEMARRRKKYWGIK